MGSMKPKRLQVGSEEMQRWKGTRYLEHGAPLLDPLPFTLSRAALILVISHAGLLGRI